MKQGHPALPTSYEAVMAALSPYFHMQRPLDFFFELFILDVLERLPAETNTALAEFSQRHPTFFARHAGNWRVHVRKELHLSDTIEVAIWDLWIRNRQAIESQGEVYDPWSFARDFTENYTNDERTIDVWTPSELRQARLRIRRHRLHGGR